MAGLQRFLSDRRGNMVAAAAVITLLVFLGIGVIVFSQVMSQANTIAQDLNDTQAQNFISDIKDLGYNSLSMLSIAAFVLAAVVILGIVARLGGGGGV